MENLLLVKFPFPLFFQDEKLVSAVLDRNLTSRLGIRMLANHHLHLKESKVSSFRPYSDIIGINLTNIATPDQPFHHNLGAIKRRFASFIKIAIQKR